MSFIKEDMLKEPDNGGMDLPFCAIFDFFSVFLLIIMGSLLFIYLDFSLGAEWDPWSGSMDDFFKGWYWAGGLLNN